ncbi:phage holin family protein [Timonella senegalensis]|uniref:phage holin family protein n=1 Tax=Timonella senegalensis TaxID=1465825 RepID=UPI0002F15005|nr:phage holin family protein [Timonella senegalensis]
MSYTGNNNDQSFSNSDSQSGSGRRSSIGELVGQLSEQVARLLRAEVNSYKSELTQKAAKSGMGIGLLVGAGVFALFGLGYLFFAGYHGLDNVLPSWAASLVTAVIILAVAGILGLVGKNTIAKNTPPTPSSAINAIKDDVNHIKDGIK